MHVRQLRDPAAVTGATLRVAVALAAGGLLYLLFRPCNLLMFQWARVVGALSPLLTARDALYRAGVALPEWLVFSVPNALWGYALAIALHAAWADTPRRDGRLSAPSVALLAAAAVPCGGEVLQAMGLVPGTFDFIDLGTALAAWVFAVVDIKKGNSCSQIRDDGGSPR